MKVYAIRDSKAECFHTPFYCRTRGMAFRAVLSAANGETELSRFPDDFMLFELGEFDEFNGLFKLHMSPEPLGLVSDLLGREPRGSEDQ